MVIRMPFQAQKAFNLVGLICILSVVGCSKIPAPITPSLPGSVAGIPTADITVSTQLLTQTSSPTFMLQLTSTITPSPRPTNTITPTLGPTFTLDERNARLIELLETNGSCELPCIWGIMPGETKWGEAFQILFPLGQPGFEISQGRDVIYSFEYQNYQDRFTIAVGMLVVNRIIVDVAHVHPLVDGDSPYFGQFWEQFSLSSLLSTNGIPSRVWVILGTSENYWPDITLFTMWLFYDEDGILIMYYDFADRADTNYRVCPNQPHFEMLAPFQFSFWTQSPDNERPLEDAYTTYTNNSGVLGYLTLQEAVGLEPDEFYDLIISGESEACFETPRDIWP